MATRIGLISDTHGLLRPEAVAFLQGSDHIVHAGDICDPAILEALAAIAPLTAVRGNNDHGPWAEGLRTMEVLQVGSVCIGVVHDIADLDPAVVAAERLRVVVSGHSHQPGVAEHGGVWRVNPGSAGPRRFRFPISVGELWVRGDRVEARTVPLL